MKTKLSKTPHAIKMRKLRKTESPREKRIRLLKRYIGYNEWACWYQHQSVEAHPEVQIRLKALKKRIKAQKAELKKLLLKSK